MPRPSEIAADARALYGPLDQRPSAQEAGDGALWIDPSAAHALYQVQSANWVQIGEGTAAPAAPAGVPVLYGPYVVDYTDIPHDGDKKTLWTAAAGDIVIWAGLDSSTLTNWDQGQVNVDQTGSNDILSLTPDGSNFTIPPVLLTAGNITASWHTAGSEASMGHVEVYVLVSRAIAP